MRNLEKILKKVEGEIKNTFSSDSSGHDFYHLRRVSNLALRIQEKEGGDEAVVAVAALLHDLHRIIQNKTRKYCSPEESLPQIKEILEKIGLDQKDFMRKVLSCIKLHEEYNFSSEGKTAKDIETLIIQDADNLDAIGAIGIARVFSFGGVHSIPIWVPEVPLPTSEWSETSPKSVSQIHHFYEKLLRLKDNMNTKTGNELAEGRHKFLEDFLEEFFKEWEGKR